jgi:hypothetical protein
MQPTIYMSNLYIPVIVGFEILMVVTEEYIFLGCNAMWLGDGPTFLATLRLYCKTRVEVQHADCCCVVLR